MRLCSMQEELLLVGSDLSPHLAQQGFDMEPVQVVQVVLVVPVVLLLLLVVLYFLKA